MSSDRMIVCFDLEGPLTAEDFGFRLAADRIPNGERIFAVLSRYDDILTERRRWGYETGETLALLLPFLAVNGVDYDSIGAAAETHASLIAGAATAIAECRRMGWSPYVVSASYEPFAHAVGHLLGLSADHVQCTTMSRDDWDLASAVAGVDATLEVEAVMRAQFADGDLLGGKWDDAIVELLDAFFYSQLPKAGCPHPGAIVRPLGGRRKARAIERVARQCGVSLASLMYVGDSITDVAAFRCLDAIGGLAVSFNGNRYAIDAATVAIASETVESVLPLLDAWRVGGLDAVRRLAHEPDHNSGVDLAWLPDLAPAQREAVVARHSTVRRLVRDAAAGLG